MDYQVTARKWRPQSFKEIIGQDSIVTTIKNALSSGKVPHAYLFSGVRGVGKTTTARVIAKALNCKDLKDFEPCNVCSSCNEITSGYSLDVIEIDGASNRGIDNIRQIKDTVTYMPMGGKYKIYIIDEVHMLTNEASNALLKTLEEPPEHAIFILATTEPHKVLPTIKSRCQHFIFRKIPTKTIMEQLTVICKQEKVKYTDEGIYLIASTADGSLRDAESIFDQVILYSEGQVNEEYVEKLLGIPDTHYFIQLIDSVMENDSVKMLNAVNDYINKVGDIKIFTRGFIQFLKNALLAKKLPVNDPLLDLTEAKYGQIKALFQPFSEEHIVRIMNLFINMFKDLKGDANERFLLEITMFKMLDYRNIIPLGELRNEMLDLIKKNELTSKPPSNQTHLSNPDAQKPVIQADKIVVDKLTTSNPRNSNSISENKIDEALIQKTMNEIIAASVIMNPMLESIKSIHVTGNAVKVEVDSAPHCEYFTRNKGDIQKELSSKTGHYMNISFNQINNRCVEPQKDKIRQTLKPEQAPENPPIQNLTSAIQSTFNGTVIK